MQAFDIYIFPSLYEGVPVSMIEAQASGLKCFISNKVPCECIITDNVNIVDLEKKAKYWAENINNSFKFKRKNMSYDIKKSGFDIEKNAKYLENYYINIYREN